MTVSSTNNKNTYAGNGVTASFAFTFSILDETQILVQIKDTAGVFTTKVLTTDYTVTGSGNTIGNTNYTVGNVIFGAGDIPLSTDTVVLTRNVPLTQNTDYVENDTFPAESHETALDKLTMISQQQTEELDRAVKIDAAVTGFDVIMPTPVANKFVIINAAADGFGLSDDTSVIGSLSAADGTFYVGDGTTQVAETGTTARASMGVTIGTDVQAHDDQLDDIAALAVTNGNFIVGDGTNWIAEAGATARASMGLTDADIKTLYESNADTNAFTDADETKLDGIEAGATTDQTDAQIKTSYEANANTNAFTDADETKLDGIEALADVTDETNVIAALDGATIPLETIAGADQVLAQDSSDSSNMITFSAQSIADLTPSKIVQVVTATTTTPESTTATIPFDNTIPQITEGAELLTASITPAASGNTLIITTEANFSPASSEVLTNAIFQDTTTNALSTSTQVIASTSEKIYQQVTHHVMTAGTTSSTTFRFRYGSNSGTCYALRRNFETNLFGGTMFATIKITEVEV